MRLSVAVAVVCLTIVGLSAADESQASIKKQTSIPAEDLGVALQSLAKERGFQLVYVSDEVRSLRTQGASGDLTPQEALTQLLRNTGFTYRYLNDNGVSIVPIDSASSSDTSSAGPPSPGVQPPATTGGGGKTEEDKSKPLDRFRVAQADQGISGDATSVDKGKKKKGSEEKNDELEEVHVNMPEILIQGSRIMNVDVKRSEDDAQPYYILDSAMIEQSGAINVEDFLKQRLTMNTTSQSNSQSYGGNLGTTSSINLRGLGANETLILIDGRRSAGISFRGFSFQPDINGIPLSAIERIEVLPSSASAIYGGAAVGGVINIILKKHFEGGELNTTYENTTSTNAPLRTVNANYGVSLGDGKPQIMISGHYDDGKALLSQDRPGLAQRGITTILQNSPSYFINPSNPFPGGATPNIASADGTNLVLKNGVSLNSPITFVPSHSAPGSDISTGLLNNAGHYNLNLTAGSGQYGLQNTFGTVPTTKSLMSTIRQQFTPDFEAFTEISTRSNASRTLFNPFTSDSFPVPGTAPANPFLQDLIVNIPTSLSEPLTTDSVTQSVTVGSVFSLPRDWKSEVDYTWSRNSFEFNYDQYDSGAFASDLATGVLDPFADTINYPLSLARYVTPTSYEGRSTLNDLGLRLSGPLASFASGHPTLTIGLERRLEANKESNFYQIFPLNPSSTQHIVYFGQSQTAKSAYAEAEVPIISENNAMRLIRSLELQLAGRSEQFTVRAGTPFAYILPVAFQAFNPTQGIRTTVNYTSTNPTIALKYSPTEDLIIRASYAKAFLPPSQSQLVPNPVQTPGTLINDPQRGESYAVNTISGGNSDLRPQTSRDWDIGLIWEPRDQVLKGLRFDLEYYKITQPNFITQPSAQQIVSNPAYASRVTRDPTTGRITVVNVSVLNAAEYRTNGWDFTLDYNKATDYGSLKLHGLATVIEHDLRQYTVGSPFLDYVGYPSEGGEGKTKAYLTLSWEYRNLEFGWSVTYYGGYRQYNSPGSPLFLQAGPDPTYTDAQGGFTIPSQTYYDLFASYTWDKTSTGRHSRFAQTLLSNLTIQAGIKNVFNTLPPFDARYDPYFYSPYGDPRLRDYRITITKSF